jgi:hypothetical protein
MTEPINLDRQAAAVRREIGLLRHLYPRWVRSGKLSKQQANDGIAAMEAVLQTLERLIEQESESVQPGLF